MTMTPELRSWYLSNLGIVQYVPKGEESVALPFHAPSEEISNEAVDSGGRLETSNSAHRAQVASVLELMGGKEPSLSKGDTQPIEPSEKSEIENDSIPSEKASDHPALNFRLACWHPCDDMLVFNQLIPGDQPDQSQKLLLSNILKAMGRLPDGLPAPELFDWPMDNAVGDSVDHSESGAKDMLSVFLDARIKKYGVLWVLLMGELPSVLLSPETLLSTENKSYTDLLGHIEEIAGGAQIIVVRSLQEMLEDPLAKAETWQTIRHLAE